MARLRDRTWRWLLAGSALIMALTIFGTFWLLDRGTRGAEVANMLGLPMGVAGVLLSALALLAPQPVHRPPALEPPGEPADPWWRKAAGRASGYVTIRTGTGLLLVLLLVVTVPIWWTPLTARARVLTSGCEHATELRVLVSHEQLEPARVLAERYRQSARRYGCAKAHPYVFALPSQQARQAIAAGWPDSGLRDTGPRPDVWIADSTWEVTQVRKDPAGAGAGAIVSDVAVAWSPIVLGVPAPGSGQPDTQLSGSAWSQLFGETGDPPPWDVVRPDPARSPAGALATALLYGDGVADQEQARSIEQRLARALDRGNYPLGGSLDVLCRQRLSGSPGTAVIVSEQALARFNNGDPLDATCRSREGQRDVDDLLLATYPSSTRSLDYRLVRFDWSRPGQADAAAGFADWLTGPQGAKALADVGLRPAGMTTSGLLTTRNGIRPDATFSRDPMPPDALDTALTAHRSAQRLGRVLLALDSSGSMAAPDGTGQDSRLTAATRGVVGALGHLGERDELGLWIFPAGPGGAQHGELVPIGPGDGPVGGQSRKSAVGSALNSIQPAGKTPLYRTIVAGVAAVEPSNDMRSSALVVLTDGDDTTHELTGTHVVNAVSGKGVRVFVVTLGEANCEMATLRDVTTTTGGRCLDADLSTIDGRLAELFGLLWNENRERP